MKRIPLSVIRSSFTVLFIALMTESVAAHVHHEHAGESSAESSTPVPALMADYQASGDDRPLERRWRSLRVDAVSDRAAPALLIEAAFVAQALHRFDDALEFARRAATQQPNNNQAWLLLASLHLVRGDNAASTDACRRLVDTAGLLQLTCMAAASIGAADGVRYRAALDGWIDAFGINGFDPALQAWVLRVAGDHAAAAGDINAAETYLRASLERAEATQVRAALFDLLLAAGDVDAARAVLPATTDSLALRVRRLIVERKTCRPSCSSSEARSLDREFRHWIEHGDFTHAREMARFYLDVNRQPELARYLALRNAETQREPEDRRLLIRTARSSSPG
ncbi:MAG: hypothetical protein AAFX44_07155 [Pseudomonadota bacterium]